MYDYTFDDIFDFEVSLDPNEVLEEDTFAQNSEETPESIYVFQATLEYKDVVSRVIKIQHFKSLYELAHVVTSAFGFDFDHAFGFYNNNLDIYRSDKIYELFVDIEDYGADPTALGVEGVLISSVWKNIGDVMYMLFDYGACWTFKLELQSIVNPTPKDLYPNISEYIGVTPTPEVSYAKDAGDTSIIDDMKAMDPDCLCPVCQGTIKAHEEGKKLGLEELQELFAKANKSSSSPVSTTTPENAVFTAEKLGKLQKSFEHLKHYSYEERDEIKRKHIESKYGKSLSQ